MPPKAISELSWKPSEDKWQLREDMNTVTPVPALRVLFLFDKKLIKSHRRNVQRVKTDLPIRQAMYLGGRPRQGRSPRRRMKMHHRKRRFDYKEEASVTSNDVTHQREDPIPQARIAGEKHLYLVANVDSLDTRYFSDMLGKVKRERACNRSEDIVKHIISQLAQAYDIQEEDIPTPKSVIVKDWSKSSAGCGWHIWKKGVKVDAIMSRMIKPLRRENIFVVGSTFCGGECQLWMEGALKTVDLMLQWYFNRR